VEYRRPTVAGVSPDRHRSEAHGVAVYRRSSPGPGFHTAAIFHEEEGSIMGEGLLHGGSGTRPSPQQGTGMPPPLMMSTS